MADIDSRTAYLLERVGCTLTTAQRRILPCPARFQLVTGGGQAGKSLLASKKFLKELVSDIKRAREAGYTFPLIYWLVAADYDRTDQEFNYIRNALAQLGLLHHASKRVDPGFLEIAGGPTDNPVLAIVRTKSAKDYRTLAKEAPMGIIVCEAGQLDLESYLRLVERSAHHRAWMFMSGTMESSLGWYPQLRIQWAANLDQTKAAFSLPTYSNLYLYPGGANDPEILRLKSETPDSFYMERVEGVPCPPRGLVFPEFTVDLHVSSDCVYRPGDPVSVWYDPGYGHACALEAAHVRGSEVDVFDELYVRGMDAEDVIDMAMGQPWWKDVRHLVIDVAGQYHQGQRPPVSQVWTHKTGLVARGQKVGVNEGSERFRWFLKVDPVTRRPRIRWSPSCRGILSELGANVNPLDKQIHTYNWDVDRDGFVRGKVPLDLWNDGIKATIYGLVDRFGYVILPNSQQLVKIRYYGRFDDHAR